jgi:ketosteroid isomerase-like protein
MTNAEDEIRAMVDRETRAWDERDAEALVDIFHPDMVWPWPPDPSAHDPARWILAQGRYDRERWRRGWQNLFDTHELIHNRRTIVMIAVSAENDGGFAVVDVDTLWRTVTGHDFQWKGRACKVYTLVGGAWKMIFQTGLLDYNV